MQLHGGVLISISLQYFNKLRNKLNSKIMIKRIVTTLSFVTMTLASFAVSNYMTVEMNSGAKISFLLADNPVITYQDDNLVINKDAKTTYSIEDIKNYHFTENDDTKVKMTNANSLVIVWVDDNTIEVQNATPGSEVSLTAVNGMVVSKNKVDLDGKATVKVSNNAGVYIISADKQSFKIIRK